MSVIFTGSPIINYEISKSENTELQQDLTLSQVEDKPELFPNEKVSSLSDIPKEVKSEDEKVAPKRRNSRTAKVATEEAAGGVKEAPQKRALRVKKSEQKELPIEESSTAESKTPKGRNARTATKVVAEEELPKTRGGRQRKKDVSNIETQPEKKQSKSTKRKDAVEKVEEPIVAEKKDEQAEDGEKPVPTNRRGRQRKVTVTIKELPPQTDSLAESQVEPGKTRAGRTRGQTKVSYNELEDVEETVKAKKPAAKRTTKRTVRNNENEESTTTEPAKKPTRSTRKRQSTEAIETDAATTEDLEEIVDEPVVVSNVGKTKRERKPVAAVQQFMDNVRARVATPKRIQQLASTSTPQPNKKVDPLPSDISAVILEESRTTRRPRGKTPLALENTNIEVKQPESEKRKRGRPKAASKALAETQEVVETTLEELKTTKTRRGAGKATQKAKTVESLVVTEKEKEKEAKPRRGAKRQASETPENANVSNVSSSSNTRGRRNVRFDETAAKVETASKIETEDSPLPAKRVMRPRRK